MEPLKPMPLPDSCCCRACGQVAGLGLFILAAQGVPEGWLLGSLADGEAELTLRLLVPACLRCASLSYH
jgi:hypothetical protein